MVSVHVPNPRVAPSTRRTTGGLCLPPSQPPPPPPIIPAVAAVFETAELGEMIFEHALLSDRARARKACWQFRHLVDLLGPKLGYERSSEYRDYDIVLENIGKGKNIVDGMKRVLVLEPDTGDVDPLTDYIFMNPYLYKYFNGNTTSKFTVKFDTKSFAKDELPKHMEHQVVAYKALGMPNGYLWTYAEDEGEPLMYNSKLGRKEVVHTELFMWSSRRQRSREEDPEQGFISMLNPKGVTLGQLKAMAVERQKQAEGYGYFYCRALLYFGNVSIMRLDGF